MSSTATKIKERRLERMRLGQAACDWVSLPSDPEIRLAIVPLTEAQYISALNKVADVDRPDDMAGAAIKDRVTAQEILVRSFREEKNLDAQAFEDVAEMLDTLDVSDIDFAFDCYQEMVAKSSPTLDGIPEKELEHLKKALQEMDWNALSGRAWYAAKRFLSEIIPTPLLDNSPGSFSISNLTTTNE